MINRFHLSLIVLLYLLMTGASASAGAETWGHDASTAFHYPAAMTRIDGTEFMGSANINNGNSLNGLISEYDKNNLIVASISFNWKW